MTLPQNWEFRGMQKYLFLASQNLLEEIGITA